MSFTDDLKRSLGFEETESNNKNKNQGPGFAELIKDLIKPKTVNNPQQTNPQQQYRPNAQHQYRPNPQQQYRPTHQTAQRPTPRPTPKQEPVYDDDVFVITPEQSYYEIVLIRPKTR